MIKNTANRWFRLVYPVPLGMASRNTMLSFALLLAGCRPATPKVQLVQAGLPRVESPAVTDAQAAQLVTRQF